MAVIAALISVNIGLLLNRESRPTAAVTVPLSFPEPSPTSAAVAPEASRNTSTRLGVFLGEKRNTVIAFEKWLGRPVEDVVHFSTRHTWDDIADPNLSEWRDSKYRLIYAVPMLPTVLDPTKETSMRAGARGEFDHYFTQLAENLVAAGHEDAVLRIGWEFNLKSWPWGISDHEVYKKYFRHVVDAVRSVPGAEFEIDWNVNNAFNPYDGTLYYPGNKYVDYIGVDAYDVDGTVYPYPKKCGEVCRLTRQTRAWDEVIFGGERGLDFWSYFAAKHKKPLSLPEFGLWTRDDGTGGGDNPFFIEQMHDFIVWAPNNVAYAAYFDYDGADGPHSVDHAFPIGGKLFRKSFGKSFEKAK